MNNEPREHPQHVVEIVRAAGAAAFGVGHRDHSVHASRSQGRGLFRDLAHEPVGAGRGGKHYDEVASPHPASPRAPEAVEGRAGVGALDLLARRERRFVQRVGLDGVHEVRSRRELEVDIALRERAEDLCVADILPRGKGAGRDAERETPGREVCILWHRRTDEPVPFEHCVGEAKLARPICNHGARLEAPRRDRDVVSHRRDTCHLVELESVEHLVFLR